MATFTPNKGYTIPTVGADLNIWGTENNNSWSLLDQNMGGTSTIPLTGGNVTATSAQAGALIQNLTGTLTSAATYTLPALGGFYMVENNTTGPFSVTIASSGGGETFVISQGTVAWLVCDGTNIIPANPDFLSGESFVNVAGNANVNATPTQAQSLVQVLQGVLTGNIQYILPAAGRAYSIYNSTTGNFTVSVAGTLSGGTSVPVPQGAQATVFCDTSGNIFPLATLAPSGSITVPVAGNANVAATTAQAAYLIQNLTGTITGPITYTIPQKVGFFGIKNATTGNFQVTVASAGGGKTVQVPQGLDTWLWTDGTNIFPPSPGWVETTSVSVVNVPAVTLQLPSVFRRFKITIQDASVAVATNLSLQVSLNGGATFVNTASYVFTAFGFNTTNGSTPTAQDSISATAFPACGASDAAPTTAIDSVVEIWPGTSAAGPILRAASFVLTPARQFGWQQTYTMGSVDTQTVNAVGIFPTAGGTLSGTFIVEGLP
jgi:hypothetical protein